jgi:hypothetical protein
MLWAPVYHTYMIWAEQLCFIQNLGKTGNWGAKTRRSGFKVKPVFFDGVG